MTMSANQKYKVEGWKLGARFDLGSIAIIALALIAFLFFAAAMTAPAQPATGQPETQSGTQGQTYVGVITDSHCGAKHSAAIAESAADCTRVCVHAGEQFTLVGGEDIYLLDGDLLQLKRAAGQRVRIVGQLSGNRIAVASVAMD